MSQIFDALHQSTMEHGGAHARDFSAAKELLQVIERNITGTTPLVEPPPQLLPHENYAQYPSASVVLAEHSKFVCFSQNGSLAAEKFRFLATRLRHIQQKRSLRRLVITSSAVGEGKSMVAANVSCALAAGKQQVLLLEGDLRRPSMGHQLGLGYLPGLTQLLKHKSDAQNIYRLENSGLCVLLAGDVHNNPLEIMEPTRLSALMDHISANFDWVVIDSPPVLPLADTSLWMRLADAVLLVTRPGITLKQQLQRSLEAIEQSKLIGSVLNASTEASGNHYYYHYAARPDVLQDSATTPSNSQSARR